MKPFQNIVILVWIVLAGCAGEALQDARYGNWGGKQRSMVDPRFDINAIEFGTRWFPAHIRWAPDDSHLLVSLCHVRNAEYCRIGKYWLADKRWELMALQPLTTYRWPSYSPDGKRMVATIGTCDEDFKCPRPRYVLSLLSPDVRQVTPLLKVIAEHPTFSDDGGKLIYWRNSGGYYADVAQYDLRTGKQQDLTEMRLMGGAAGWPLFLPGGESFVFGATFHISNITGRPPDDFSGGGLFDSEKGPNKNVIMFAADIKDGPARRERARHLRPLWTDGFSGRSHPMDVTTKGEVLYLTGSQQYAAKRAAGVYRANVLDFVEKPGDSRTILMLRPARAEAQDTAAFLMPSGAQEASVAHDGRRVAFLEMNPMSWANGQRMGIVSLDDQQPQFIDWPRLQLDPSAIKTRNQRGQSHLTFWKIQPTSMAPAWQAS